LPHRFDPVHGVGFRADSAGSGLYLHEVEVTPVQAAE
jgi:hypothetical protein